MKRVEVIDGDVVCPKCGARNQFQQKRTGKAKWVGVATVGVGMAAMPKRLKCNGCGSNLKRNPVAQVRPPSLPGAPKSPQDETPPFPEGEGDIVRLVDAGPKVIHVIKIVRRVTGATLKDAKAITDDSRHGSVLVGAFAAEEAQQLAKELRGVGATVEVEAAPTAAADGATLATPERPVNESKVAPPQDGGADVVAALERLTRLRDNGALTPEQFEVAKQRVLDPDA